MKPSSNGNMLLKSNKDCDAEKLTTAFTSSVNFKGIDSKFSKPILLSTYRVLLASSFSLLWGVPNLKT